MRGPRAGKAARAVQNVKKEGGKKRSVEAACPSAGIRPKNREEKEKGAKAQRERVQKGGQTKELGPEGKVQKASGLKNKDGGSRE